MSDQKEGSQRKKHSPPRSPKERSRRQDGSNSCVPSVAETVKNRSTGAADTHYSVCFRTEKRIFVVSSPSAVRTDSSYSATVAPYNGEMEGRIIVEAPPPINTRNIMTTVSCLEEVDEEAGYYSPPLSNSRYPFLAPPPTNLSQILLRPVSSCATDDVVIRRNNPK